MEIIDLCTARRGAVEQDMVRIDPMTAIPRWEERTVLQENHMKLFLNGVPEETLVCTPTELSALVLEMCIRDRGADQLKNKRALQQRLAAGQRHAAGAQERTVRQQAFHQLLHRDFPAAFKRPGVRIVTVDAAQRAALKKDYIAYAWPVHEMCIRDSYFAHIKPKPLPAAMSEVKKGWICKICGYVYEGEELPPDYICPICKHGVSDFEKLG